MKCKECGQEIERETVIVDGWEYTIRDEQKGKKFSKIETPKGWELWDYEDCIKLSNDLNLRKKLNLEDCWFFIKQFFKQNKGKEFIARFGAYVDGADLNCSGDPDVQAVGLGVRFKKKHD